MIYLKNKKILFIKPLKTASTSLEIAFSCNASIEDIVTPMSTNYELMRLEKGAQLPTNYATSRFVEKRYRAKIYVLSILAKLLPWISLDTLESCIKPFFKNHRKTKVAFNHIKPEEVAARFGEKFLEDSFVVTMCRHPYEVLVSRVYWEKWKKEHTAEFDFSAAVDKMLLNEPLNLDYYFYKGKFIPGFVIRYEHLDEDIASLEQKFGLKLSENMPRTKDKVRASREPAFQVLTEKQKQICYEKNKPIFDQFGYVR